MYILEVLCFIKQYQDSLQQKFSIHGHNTINIIYSHATVVPFYQGSVTNMGIKLFNNLPIKIIQLRKRKGFKKEVKTCLLHNSIMQIENFCTFRKFAIAHCLGTTRTNCTCVNIVPKVFVII